MQIPIEDFYEDVLAKTAKGLGFSASSLAEHAGLDRDAVREALRGDFVEEEARKLAPVLNLDADALVLLGQSIWRPQVVNLDGLALFNSAFADMTVNAFVVWDPSTKEAAIFDSGADASELIAFVQNEGLKVQGVWVTHTHRDHIKDIPAIVRAFDCPIYVGEKELANFGTSFAAGEKFSIGTLTIESKLTWGHARGGITYVVSGLGKPIAVVGDALFAQSMGGGMISFKDALETSGQEIMTLPDEAVICPGHGPMSSVGEEKRVNPFFAGKF